MPRCVRTGSSRLLHGFSALGTLELHATPRMDIYANYGGDYVGRNYFTDTITGKAAGYGNPAFSDSGCGKEPGPGTTPDERLQPLHSWQLLGQQPRCAGRDTGLLVHLLQGTDGAASPGIAVQLYRASDLVWNGVGGRSSTQGDR